MCYAVQPAALWSVNYSLFVFFFFFFFQAEDGIRDLIVTGVQTCALPIFLDLYGVKHPGNGSFASNCLMARRLAERGVRFIQLYHRAWDHHKDIEKDIDRKSVV